MAYWARNLKSFATASNIGDLESLDKEGVNKLLCLFVIQLKKADGSEYETSSMHFTLSVLGRYVTDIGKGDVEKDVEYQGLRDVKKSQAKTHQVGREVQSSHFNITNCQNVNVSNS